MIPQFQHKLSSSFLLWFDNYLLTKGQAYTNTTGRFYYYQDERVPNTYKVFGSPYKQWVSDYSITAPHCFYFGGFLLYLHSLFLCLVN